MEEENSVSLENNSEKKLSDTYSFRCGSEYVEQLREVSKNYANKTEFAKAILNSINASDIELLEEKEAEIQKFKKLLLEYESDKTNIPQYKTNKVVSGFLLVPCNEFELRCLEYLTAREKKNLGNDLITPGMIYQYILRTWFIDGDNFGLDSIPNSKLKTIKERL